MTVYLGKKPVGVTKIVKKEVAKTKFGASVDTFLGDVDENGALQGTTWTGALNLAEIKEVSGVGALKYKFYGCTGITSVDLSSLQSVGSETLSYTFYGCTGITSVDLSSLTTAYINGIRSTFYGCTSLTSVDLSSLQSIGSTGLQYAFYGCTSLTSVDLSSLQSIGSNGLQYAFYGCKLLTTMSFPSLVDVQTNSFGSSTLNGAFRNCTGLTEIHFRADMQATIEAMSQYANKWGATNASIIFDL